MQKTYTQSCLYLQNFENLVTFIRVVFSLLELFKEIVLNLMFEMVYALNLVATECVSTYGDDFGSWRPLNAHAGLQICVWFGNTALITLFENLFKVPLTG